MHVIVHCDLFLVFFGDGKYVYLRVVTITANLIEEDYVESGHGLH